MNRRLLAVALVVGVAGASIAAASSSPAAVPADAVSYPAGFCYPIYVGSKKVYTPPNCTATTVASTTTTSTTLPASTTSTAVTTTAPATTTTAPPTTTTTPTSTTIAPAGTWTEDFASPTAFTDRFDHGWSGQALGSDGTPPITTWMGDHDESCGDPLVTHRTITISATDHEQVWYPCTFAGNAAKSHLMSSVQTKGYNIAWFAPKQTFTDVTKVCWNQNLTDLGGGKWTAVVIVPVADVDYYKQHPANGNPVGTLDLGFVDPEFDGRPGAETGVGTGIVPRLDEFGIKNAFRGSARTWQGRSFTPIDGFNYIYQNLNGFDDHATRYRTCMTDNRDGTVTVDQNRPAYNGEGPRSFTVPGHFPSDAVRVAFLDDNYNPDKHFNDAGIPPNDHSLTWHWDDIQITSG